MTTTANEITYRLEQKRRVQADFPGPKSVALTERRKAVVAAGVASSVPVYVADADGGIIHDVDGNFFIDLGSGIAVTSVGASDPAVVGAVKEAVENAVKVARLATGRDAVVAFDHAYHGRTNLTMALTAKAMPYKTNFGPFAPEVYRMPMSYPFREENPEITGAEAAKRAITMIEKQIGGEQVAAIIIEPIQGEGGFIVPADGFLPALADWAKDKGIVFIADEVQSGFCRTGEWFAVNHEGVVPDIITMAKGIAGGMPLSAITGRADLLDAVHPGGLGGTYGGNPVACAAALASIDSMEQYDLNGRAKHIEEIALGKLRGLAAELADSSVIGDVRGRGAMLAIELVQAGSKEPNPELTKAVAAACLKEGVIILTCGTYGNVIRLLPPLVISDELLLDGLEVLAAAVRANA